MKIFYQTISAFLQSIQASENNFLDRLSLTALLLFLILPAFLLDMKFFPATLEDAFITFRYSTHLAQGYGLGAWNMTGEKVEGFTSFLWMLMLAVAPIFRFSLVAWSKVLGICFHLLMITALFISPIILQKPNEPQAYMRSFVPAAIITAFYMPVNWYATSGMETIGFSALILLVLLVNQWPAATWLCWVVNAAVVLMRPEGLLVSWFFNSTAMLKNYWDKVSIQKPLAGFLSATITILLLTVFRLLYFKEILPNTYFAKASASLALYLPVGVHYLFHWYHYSKLLVYGLGLGLVMLGYQIIKQGLRPHITMLSIFVFLLLYAAYVISVGGDNLSAFPFWRHMVHVLPLLALAIGYGLAVLLPFSRVLIAVLALGMVWSVNQSVIYWHDHYVQLKLYHSSPTFSFQNAPHNPYYLWLKKMTSSQTIIASSLGGELPYVVDAQHLDMLGLNDRHIAHQGVVTERNNPMDSKIDIQYIFAQKPDLIEASFSGNMLKANKPLAEIITRRKPMCLEIIQHPSFQKDYCFVLNAPYADLDRALFIKKAYWLIHPRKNEILCIDVSATSLKAPAKVKIR